MLVTNHVGDISVRNKHRGPSWLPTHVELDISTFLVVKKALFKLLMLILFLTLVYMYIAGRALFKIQEKVSRYSDFTMLF